MEKEKKLYETLGRDCIVVPRQAMGKLSDNNILGAIFSMLPLFYEEDRKDTILLTLKDMVNHLFFTDSSLLKNITTINNTHLYFIQILRNNLFKVTIQRENMDKFLKDVYRLECVIIKNDTSAYENDEKLSFTAIKLLNLLLSNENLKNIDTHFDFSWVLTSISFTEKEEIEKIKNALEELKKVGYCYLFDILDRTNLNKGIEKQVIIISNSLLSAGEAKGYINLPEEKIAAIYPVGEVR